MADAAAFGLALPMPEGPEDFEVWQENWDSVGMFLRCQTQWRVAMNGLLGFDYGALAWLFRLYEVEDPRSLLEDLQLMEGAVMQILNKESK